MSLITFHEFMKDKNVFSDHELDQLEILERNLTPINFAKNFSGVLAIICGNNLSDDDLRLILSNQKRLTTFPLNNYRMNRRGLHISRILFSHHAFRLNSQSGMASTYTENGIFTIENFVADPNVVAGIINESSFIAPSVHKLPGNIIFDNIQKLKHSAWLLYKSGLKERILETINKSEDAEALDLYYRNTFIQTVINEPGNNDHQKLIHSDIFFPAIKFWYFPQQVTISDGPLNYVPGSTKITRQLLNFYYQQMLDICSSHDFIAEWRGKDHVEGSFRVSETELDEMGYHIEPVMVPANTLVIANVFGFHARGDALVKNVRTAIHGSIRCSVPFA